jgi:hypothetical protein
MLRTAFSSRGRVEEVELGVSVQLASSFARAGRRVQVVPYTTQDDPRESKCKGVSPGAAMRWVCIAFAIDFDVLTYSRCFEATRFKKLKGF